MHAGVDDRVGVPDLPVLVAGIDGVDRVVVVEWIGDNQAVDHTLNLGQPHHSPQGRVLPQLRHWRPGPTARDPRLHLSAGGLVELGGHQFVEAQKAGGDELRHLFGIQ